MEKPLLTVWPSVLSGARRGNFYGDAWVVMLHKVKTHLGGKKKTLWNTGDFPWGRKTDRLTRRQMDLVEPNADVHWKLLSGVRCPSVFTWNISAQSQHFDKDKWRAQRTVGKNCGGHERGISDQNNVFFCVGLQWWYIWYFPSPFNTQPELVRDVPRGGGWNTGELSEYRKSHKGLLSL